MRDDRDSESATPFEQNDEAVARDDGTLQMLPEPVNWALEDLYAETVLPRPAMLFWDDFLKLPSGSRLVFWNLMIHSLRASGFDESRANQIAEQDAKMRNKPWPHKAPYVSVACEGLRRNVRLFRYRFNPHTKEFFIVVLMGPQIPDGPRSGQVIGWFEAKSEADVNHALMQIQDAAGVQGG